MPWHARAPFHAAWLAAAIVVPDLLAQPPSAPPQRAAAFEWPLANYQRGLRGQGNFGVLITDQDSAFEGSYHLAEDVWLPARTPVRSIAAGVVRYSDFSPSWKDQGGRIHWNLGNVIVIEHALVPPVDGVAAVCSVYVHLGTDRRVKAGDAVTTGQVIGTIGRDRSEENGLCPAHLHFGIHKGPYLQISPAWRRSLEEEAKTTGIAAGPGEPIRGEIEVVPATEDSVVVKSRLDGRKCILSLLVGSTAPKDKPADIVGWCSGYGDKLTVDEWLRPSGWLADRMKTAGDDGPPRGRKP